MDLVDTPTGDTPVRLSDADAVRRWAKQFGVSEQALARAVERVGEDFRAVQRELGGRR